MRLTGNINQDLELLSKAIDKYNKDPDAKQILEALEELTLDVIPEEYIKDAENILKVNLHKKDNDLQKSIVILEDKITRLEKQYTDQHYDFANFIEYIIFSYYHKQIVQPLKTDEPLCDYCAILGNLYYQENDFDNALKSFTKALRWTPISSLVYLNLANCYLEKKDYDSFLSNTKEALKYAYEEKDIFLANRNIAIYFIQKEQYTEAYAALKVACSFGEQKEIQDELVYLNSKNQNITDLDEDTIKQIYRTYDLQLGASQDIINLCIEIGKTLQKSNDFEHADYLINIAYNLSQDAEIKKYLSK